MSILNRRHHKITYYIKSIIKELYPSILARRNLYKKLRPYNSLIDKKYIDDRVNYYNKLSNSEGVRIYPSESASLMTVGSFRKTGSSVYYFDLAPLIRYFPQNFMFNFLAGDITHIPEQPTLLKSRPISSENQNSILLKLNKVRHYYYENDPYYFEQKKPLIVWRGADHQAHRKDFLNQYFDSPFCDIGSSGKRDSIYKKDFMTIADQCRYKYIMSIEGNDVATNLKWIFRTNSVCFMRKPRYETWFMEGSLKPNIHYIEIKDDYSDLEEKFNFCEQNPELMLEIIQHAKNHAQQFDDEKQEELISLLVLKKYFNYAQKRQ